jgi:hypothetical protein
MTAPIARSTLDGLGARLGALAVALLAAGALVFIHRNDLFPKEAPKAAAAPDPFQECMAARGGDIDRMVAEKTIDAARGELFRARAEAMCRSEADKALGKNQGLPPGLVPTQRF